MSLKEGDIALNTFSPTGFYSSAVNNQFMKDLYARKERQVAFLVESTDEFNTDVQIKNKLQFTAFYKLH
jgi:hypothetical protein